MWNTPYHPSQAHLDPVRLSRMGQVELFTLLLEIIIGYLKLYSRVKLIVLDGNTW